MHDKIISPYKRHTYGAAYKNTVLDIKSGKLLYSFAPILLKMKPVTYRTALHGKAPVTLQAWNLLYAYQRDIPVKCSNSTIKVNSQALDDMPEP
jgi:hypothetical protein